MAFVLLFFGLKEVVAPARWLTYAPSFLGTGSLATSAVLFHGILLSVTGLALIIKFYPRVFGALAALMLLQIIVQLIVGDQTVTEVTARDIGLFGMALAIALSHESSTIPAKNSATLPS